MGAEAPTLTNKCFKRLTNTEALWVYLRMEHTPIHGNLNGEKINLAAARFLGVPCCWTKPSFSLLNEQNWGYEPANNGVANSVSEGQVAASNDQQSRWGKGSEYLRMGPDSRYVAGLADM